MWLIEAICIGMLVLLGVGLLILVLCIVGVLGAGVWVFGQYIIYGILIVAAIGAIGWAVKKLFHHDEKK